MIRFARFARFAGFAGCAAGALACTVLQTPPAIRPCSSGPASSPQTLKVTKTSVPQHVSSALKISPIFPAQGRHSLTRTWAHPLPQISNSPSWPASLNTLTRTLSSPLGLSQAYCPCLPIPAACPSALHHFLHPTYPHKKAQAEWKIKILTSAAGLPRQKTRTAQTRFTTPLAPASLPPNQISKTSDCPAS